MRLVKSRERRRDIRAQTPTALVFLKIMRSRDEIIQINPVLPRSVMNSRMVVRRGVRKYSCRKRRKAACRFIKVSIMSLPFRGEGHALSGVRVQRVLAGALQKEGAPL